MAAELLGGTDVEAVFGELLSAVLEFKDKAIDFKVTLSSFGSTLEAIDPLIKEIEKQNIELGAPKEELDRLIREMKEGTKLVRKCSQIHRLNFAKKARYKDKLDALEGKIKNFFIIALQAQLTRDHKETLLEVRRIQSKVDKLPLKAVNDMQAIASSSSSCFIYDVFLNFRGEDTRHGFTGNLYNALSQKGIHTFIDDEGLERGEDITQSLIRAIQGSKIAITIFSENYASSRFCLEELLKILECMDGNGQLVLPVFYKVEPSDVKHQRGSYGEALAKYQHKHKVEEWRLALHKVASLAGFHFKGYEYVLIGKIIEAVSKKLSKHSRPHIANPEAPVQEVNEPLGVGVDDEKVKMVATYPIDGKDQPNASKIDDSTENALGTNRETTVCSSDFYPSGVDVSQSTLPVENTTSTNFSEQLKDSITSPTPNDQDGASDDPLNTSIVGPWGGNGGNNWDDGIFNGVRQVTLRYDYWIHSFIVVYDKQGQPFMAEKRGGNGGQFTAEIELEYPYESLIEVYGHSHQNIIFSLTFKSNRRIFGPYGLKQGTYFTYALNANEKIVGFFGRSGWYLDSLGIHIIKKHNILGPCGGNGGGIWDDGIFNGVRRLTIRHGLWIDSITVTYDKQGETFIAEKHGGEGGSNIDEIELRYPNEFLIEVSGYYNDFVIWSLTLKSNQRNFGPYGTESGTYFTFSSSPNQRIVGFLGRSGSYLDAIGVHLSHSIN